MRKSTRAALITASISGLVFAASGTAHADLPALATVHIDATRSAAAFVASHPSVLQASAGDAYIAHPAISADGLRYLPYDRTFKGLPVVGGDFVVVVDAAGNVVYNSVAQTTAIGDLAVTPRIAASAAAATSAHQLPGSTTVEGTKLVVYGIGTPRLAWETYVDGRTADGPSRLSVEVDALTGAVLGTKEHVLYGTGTSAYNGTVPLSTTRLGSTYQLRDPSITNLSCQDAATNVTFSGPDDLWGNGNATSKETGCVDALFAAQTEVKMLATWDGRNGMDGFGGAWPIRVGLTDQNSFYDGSQVQIGHNAAGQWIGALDVVGHEMGHGVDDTTPGGLSGGNTGEFVADTFGAATEWYANEAAPYDTPDFVVGDQINLTGNGPTRYMYNPSIQGDPNCYSSLIPNEEVHTAAGPGDHWFYLVAEGTNPTNGQPVSPTCNNTTFSGLGIQTAEKIMYNAMLLKTTASSYPKYRVWTLQAAKTLTPGDCTAFNTVKAAWTAVSVPAQAGEATCTPVVTFHTGFETTDPALTWTNTVNDTNLSKVVALCCGATGPESGIRTGERAHTGTGAVLYSGLAQGGPKVFAYMKIYDLSANPVSVDTANTLSYWIFPQSSATNAHITPGSTNSGCAAIDLIFTDGTTLRDSGAVDQNGVRAHPAFQCGHLTLDTWNHVTVNLSTKNAGKKISRILLAFDDPNATGGYRGYIDDLTIS